MELFSSLRSAPGLQFVANLFEVMQHNHLRSKTEYQYFAKFSLKSLLAQRRCKHWHFNLRKLIFGPDDSSWLYIM